MTPILQSHLPFAPWMDPRTARLPGILPLEDDDWLRVDDAFDAQMAERDRLIAKDAALVHGLHEAARPAAAELLELVLAKVRQTPGYLVAKDHVTRPDGAVVTIDRAVPLLVLGRLVQEDLCILQHDGAEHVLSGAILCFPANWTLAEKLGRPMVGIHVPVASYGADLARRVQRLLDAIRPEQPLWRANALIYDDPTLHQPRPEATRRAHATQGQYLRSERQCLLRLPQTRAVVFTIHTYVVRLADLEPAARAAMAQAGF